MFYSRCVSFEVFYNSKKNCYYNFNYNKNNTDVEIIEVPHPELAYKLESESEKNVMLNNFDQLIIPDIEIVTVKITIDAKSKETKNENM